MTRIDRAYTAEEAKKCFIKLKNRPLQKRNKETGLEFGPPTVCIRSFNIFSKKKKKKNIFCTNPMGIPGSLNKLPVLVQII